MSIVGRIGQKLMTKETPVSLEGRIDIAKLKKEIRVAERMNPQAGAWSLLLEAAPKESKIYDNEVPRTTVLYALRSHLRGKLHMTKKRYIVGPFGGGESGTEILPVTMDDQARLISGVWEEFRLEEEEQPAEAIGQ
jgi:hypothetical protein